MDPENTEPVRSGTWLYDEAIPCAVRILKHHTLYGTGDHEDIPEIAEDHVVECFHVFYQTPAGNPKWTRGGGALTLAEAIAMTEAAVKVRWDGETC